MIVDHSLSIVTAVCIAIISIVYFVHRRKMNYFKNLGIPHIPPVPLFGNMAPLIFRNRHVTCIIEEIYNVNTEAKYVGAYDFIKPIFVIRDPELIKTIAVKNFDNFPDHRSIETNDTFFGKNLVALRGEKWREVRNLLSPAFTSSKMKMMFNLMSNCADNFSSYLVKEYSAMDKNLLESKDVFSRYTTDVIATCAFGVDVNSMKDKNNEFFKLGKEVTTFGGLIVIKMILIQYLPKIMKLLKINIFTDRVKLFFTNLVRDIIKERDEKGIHRPDMLQLMMDARGNDNNKVELDIEEMTAQAFVFFFGGFDTSSNFMCFLGHQIAAHPEIQRKLQEEIDEVIKVTDGNITYEAVNGMMYLDAVFNETLRLYPLAPVIDRLCVKSFELPPALPGLKPVTIKEGNTIWFAVAGIHFDPQYYEDPKKFDPERFLSKKVSSSQTTFLPFGIGPRMCIGNRFALLETKVLFFHLLSKCNLKLSDKTTNPLEMDPKSWSFSVKGGFWLKLEKRIET